MKARHLAGRFVRAVWPGPPRAQDEAWVATVLLPSELPLFSRLANHDRRHAIGVAREVQDRLGGECEDRWLAAALLHDVGKQEAGLSVPGRVLTTLVIAWRGRDRVARGRGRIAAYARHGEIGAAEIEAAGGRQEAADWAGAHHRPEAWDGLGWPAAVVRELDAADNA